MADASQLTPLHWYLDPVFLPAAFGLLGVLVGGLITAGSAYLLDLRREKREIDARSHDFEKERRRRKQDCLERVVEDLDENQSALDSFLSSSLTAKQFKNDENVALRRRAFEMLNVDTDKSVDAQMKLNRSVTKLTVFGFPDCSRSLGAYDTACTQLKVKTNGFREENQTREEYDAARTELFTRRQALTDAVFAAFADL
jgi:hypothetical protein